MLFREKRAFSIASHGCPQETEHRVCLGAKVLGPHPRAVVWSHWAPEGEEGVMDVEAGTRHPPPRAIQPCSSTHLPPLSLPSCLSQASYLELRQWLLQFMSGKKKKRWRERDASFWLSFLWACTVLSSLSKQCDRVCRAVLAIIKP